MKINNFCVPKNTINSEKQLTEQKIFVHISGPNIYVYIFKTSITQQQQKPNNSIFKMFKALEQTYLKRDAQIVKH